MIVHDGKETRHSGGFCDRCWMVRRPRVLSRIARKMGLRECVVEFWKEKRPTR